MPHTTMVADFVQTLGSFYEVVDDKGLPNGSTRRENGFPAIEGSPPENGSDGNMLPIPESDFSSGKFWEVFYSICKLSVQ